MKEGLVSIITPCYNGEKYVEKYLNSILNQTYTKIEVIFINDGSTDNTERIVKNFIKRFEKKGIKLIYIYQENSGQAAALNKGLKIFDGEFLTWPDADDILYNDSIEKRVQFLKNNKQYGLVRNEIDVIDFDTEKKIGEFKLSKKYRHENIFEDLIFGNNIFYAPISYMVNSKDFLDVNSSRTIFETRYGQNWQMLLPITFKYKCGYIDKKLCEYIVRKDSHSRTKIETVENAKERNRKHIEILENVLKPMGLYEYYKNRIYEKYSKILLRQAYIFNDRKLATEAFDEINKYGKANLKDIIIFYSIKYSILKKIIELIKR